MEKKEMASPSGVEWQDGTHLWGLASDHKPEKEFFESILRSKKLFRPGLNKPKLGNVKRFEKLFSQPGLYPGVKILLDRELTDREKKQINDAVKVETSKFPHMKIVTLVGEDQKGKIHVEFVHKTRPKRTPVDQINDLIASEKKKIKGR